MHFYYLFYLIGIFCTFLGSPRLTGSATVFVIVDDLNDSPPEFALKEYFAFVMENLPPLSPIITITASDADLGRNAEIR